jgi:CTP:molybdopterin cytidylyltransferase MocA
VTVAAVILATPDAALADADGVPGVRRIIDSAWAGGAVPIIIVADDPRAVAGAIAGSAAQAVASPGAGASSQIMAGAAAAADRIEDTSGVLVWPAAMVWVGPETVTSLVEAHGPYRQELLRPAYDGTPGWPVLVPGDRLPGLATGGEGGTAEDVIEGLVAGGARVRQLELGDPGAVHDVGTSRSSLPPYLGPDQPASGHVHEWGAGVADHSDDGPLEGPGLAPYGQAVALDPEQPG